ncbi:hypothetical protein KXD40_007441 [Peronospora effusa]|nr:hypothetical protein KXD40_007441 [Peronospora effusa]
MSWLPSVASSTSDGAVSAENESIKVTPMVAQYLARKKEYPDCMLLFQVGDFYEFFGDDARRTAHVMNNEEKNGEVIKEV